MRTRWTRLGGVAWLAASLFAGRVSMAQPRDARPPTPARPNVIFILVDDMGYGDLGCYGNRHVRTPNIDRFAAEGTRYARFYVASPICSPSRVAFTTGQHPARWRITSYIDHRAANDRRGMAQWLPPDAPSLARTLGSAGYRTAHVGKWHMGGGRDVGDAPLITEYGFDTSLTQFEGLGDRLLPTFETLFPKQDRRAHPLALRSAELGRGRSEFVPRHEVTGRFVDRSIALVRAARDAGQPFYLNLWPDDVHSPHEPSAANRGDGSVQAMYRGVIEELDRDLGRLFDVVRDDPQLRSNTLIVFASDNGHDPLVAGAAGLRGHKATLYEGGVRVPFIVWWPGGNAPAGQVNEQTVVSGLDLPPTLMSLCGVPAPPDVAFDGRDMSATFRGAAQPRRDGPLFWLRPPDRPGPGGSFPDLAIRRDQWKLLIEEDGSAAQLYDVEGDPTESRNVAAEHPRVVDDLKAELLAWRKQMPQPQQGGPAIQ